MEKSFRQDFEQNAAECNKLKSVVSQGQILRNPLVNNIDHEENKDGEVINDFPGRRVNNPNPIRNQSRQKPDNMDDSSSKFSLQFGCSIDQHSEELSDDHNRLHNNAIEEVSEDEKDNSEIIEVERIKPRESPYTTNKILNDKYINKHVLQKKIKRSNSLQQDLAKEKLQENLNHDYMDVNSEQYLQNETEVKQILQEIQRVVQQGGNMCHRSFRSFGESN